MDEANSCWGTFYGCLFWFACVCVIAILLLLLYIVKTLGGR